MKNENGMYIHITPFQSMHQLLTNIVLSFHFYVPGIPCRLATSGSVAPGFFNSSRICAFLRR
jgi:hypothetical protein